MAATMRQVAERAGVSLKSVSRVVNGEPNVSERLRERVMTAVAELDWHPSTMARTLRTGRTEAVALLVPHLNGGWLASLTQALVVEADHRGLQVSIEPAGPDPAHALALLREQSTSYDGAVLLTPLHLESLPPLPPLGPSGLPVSVVRACPGEAAVGAARGVRLDRVQAARAMAHHLRALRLHRPVLVGPGAEDPTSLLGALATLLPPVEVLPTATATSRALGWEVLGAGRLPGRADVVVCADDSLALGALARLREQGVRVPEDVALCGCGGLDDGRFCWPSLTTLTFPFREVARLALDDLERAWGATGAPALREDGPAPVVSAALVRRESTLGLVARSPQVLAPTAAGAR